MSTLNSGIRTTFTVASLLLALQAYCADSAQPLGKLPRDIQPLAYRLDLTILPEQADFAGVTEIDIDVRKPSSVIWMHANGLVISSATLRRGTAPARLAHLEQVDPTGVARLSFEQNVAAGRATLRFVYTGKFGSSSEGLYHTTVSGKSYAFTQFESIDARRMFPSFDEPSFKTPFDIAVTTASGNTVIGNTPIIGEAPAGENRKRVVFSTTKPLPTYLLALAVGPLDIVEGRALASNRFRDYPLPLRAAATSGHANELHFAIESTEPIVSYLENYFGSAFPYPKLDLIGTPEFGAGAMENAGAIMYGEAALLIPDNASLDQRRRFGSVHAHELSHQWFGDLVTPKWWDDAWLNESFANWMGYKAAHAWRPNYHLDISPLLQAFAAMDSDSRIAARQIRQPVPKNSEVVNAFDGITYLKGGAVLQMFESYLGEERFRGGVRTHMRRFANSVADAEDFMTSLAQGSGRPDVVPAFRSFIYQAGLPLVDVKLDCGKGAPALQLAQSRYLPVGSRGDPNRGWQVPLCLRFADGPILRKQCVLLRKPAARVALKADSCPVFVMPNADAGGYYRFALDEAGWNGLLANFDRLNEREAISAADSLAAAYQANRLSTDALISASRAIAKSRFPQAALAPSKILIRLRDDIATADSRAPVTALIRSLYRPRLDAIGVDAPATTASTEDAAFIDEALFRTNLVRLLALDARDPELRTTLAAQAQRYLNAGSPDGALDPSAVDPDRTQIALQVGVQELGTPFVELLISRMLQSTDSRFRMQAATALGGTDDAALGERVRKLLLEPKLHGREPTTLASALTANPKQRRATFDWFKANQQAYIARISAFAHRWLPLLASGLCTRSEHDEVQAVFAPVVDSLQGAGRTLAETLEGIELCAALAETKHDEVARSVSQLAAPAR
jgi:alanyl aminopeptidase